MTTTPLIIWRFRDGKPGHEQQSLGLVHAIQQQTSSSYFDIDVRSISNALFYWLMGKFPFASSLPAPHLLIGAGHATHIPLLAARRAFGSKAVVLMKPSLPRFLFDLIIVPEHDGLSEHGGLFEGKNVITTQGALNTMQPGEKRKGSVLVLLGGESRHGRWDSALVTKQVEEIAEHTGADFLVTDSRRTPEALAVQLASHYKEKFKAWQDCPQGWLCEQLAVTETVWVTEDSASMIYEALSAGCRVGVLPLAETNDKSRVLTGIKKLAQTGNVQYLGQKIECAIKGIQPLKDTEPLKKAGTLQEANRVAAIMLAKGFLQPDISDMAGDSNTGTGDRQS